MGQRRLVRHLRSRKALAAVVLLIGAAALLIPTFAGADSAPVITNPADGAVLGPSSWDKTVTFTSDPTPPDTFTLFRDPNSGSCPATPAGGGDDVNTELGNSAAPLLDSGITEGSWCYWVEADYSGTLDDSNPVAITYDATAPTDPSGLTLTGTGTVRSVDPAFTFTTSTDANGPITYELYRDGVATGVMSSTGSITDTSLASDGSDDLLHHYTVKATDAALNVSGASNSVDVTTDFTAPTVPVLTLSGTGSTHSTRPSFTFTASTDAHGPVTYALYRDGVATGDTTTTVGTITDTTVGLLDGTHDGLHTYTLVASDALTPANVSDPSNGVSYTIDTVAPSAPATFTLSGSADTNTDPSFTFTAATDATSAVTYELDRGGVSTGITASSPGTITDTTLASNGSDDGLHAYTLVAIDAAGNRSVPTAAVDVTTDFTKPTAPSSVAFSNPATPTNVKPTITFHASTEATSEPVTYRLFRDTVDTGLSETTAASTGSIQDTTLRTTGADDGIHTWTLTATDNAGNTSVVSSSISLTYDTTPPPTPTGFAATATLTNLSPSFTFNRTDDTLSQPVTYTLYRDGVTTGITATTSNPTGTITDTTETTDGTYSYTLVATDHAGNAAAATSPVSVTTDFTAPAVPTGLALSNTPAITNHQPSFTFTPTTDPHGPVQFTLYRDGVATANTSSTGTISDATLPMNSSGDGLHSYTIKAADSLGNASAQSSPAVTVTTDFTPPAAPTGFVRTSTATTNTAPAFSFGATTDPHGPVTFELYRKNTGTGVTVDTGVSVQSGSTIADTAIALDGSADGSYSYTLRAIDAVGNSSGDSTAATVTLDAGPPTVPGGLHASASPTRTSPVISWSASSGGPAVYQVRRNGTPIGSVFAPITTFTDSSLALDGSADGTYAYTVVSIDAANNVSAPSTAVNVVLDTTRPAPSPALTATSPTAAKPVLVWPASPAGDQVAGYNVYRGSTKLNTSLVTGTTFTDSGLVGDGTYTYTVRAVDQAGNESADSVAAVVVYDTTPPVAPAISATAGRAAGTAALSWSAGADAGSGVVSYEIRRSAANGAAPVSPAAGTPVCGTPAATVLTCTDEGLTPGASFRYSVFAVDAVGNVSAAGSSAAISIPAAADTTPPKAPTAVKRVVTATTITLTWKNPKADLAKVVVVWNAKRAPRSASDGTSVYKGTGTKIAVKLSKLPAGKKVYFAVFALDKAGNASRAAGATVSVPASTPLSVAPGGKLSGSPALSWKPVNTATYYNVQVFEGNGTTKRVAIAWPAGTSYVLPAKDLVKGKTYTWYVWPGVGAKAAAKYGALIGKQTFTYTG
jgi:large repetitive protein